MRVEVYFNLHRKCWSVRDVKTRRVIMHLNRITLTNCTMHVSQAGRERVLREKRKNVHAFIRGTLPYDLFGEWELDNGRNVSYNPYKYDSFVDKETEQAVHRADVVIFDGKSVTYGG